MPKAEALSTRERWASVGTYSAVTLRFQSLKQGTRARYTESGGGDVIIEGPLLNLQAVVPFDVHAFHHSGIYALLRLSLLDHASPGLHAGPSLEL